MEDVQDVEQDKEQHGKQGDVEEAFEEKTFILVNPVGQWQQGAHLPHQLGGLLVSSQGEGHEFLIPLERVEGV